MGSSNSDHITLYHYTDEQSAKEILNSGIIRQSTQIYGDAIYGNGTYLTALGPDVSIDKLACNNYDGSTSFWEGKRDKFDVALEMKVPKSKVENHSYGDRNVFKYAGDIHLKDIKDLKVYPRGQY